MVGEIIIGIGLLLFLIGVIAQFRYRAFYKKLLVASLIDSAGLILVFAGIIIRQGINAFSFKVLMIFIIIMLINPLATHKLGRSAYLSRLGDKDDN